MNNYNKDDYNKVPLPKAPTDSFFAVKILKAIVFGLFASVTTAFTVSKPAFALPENTDIATVTVAQAQENPFLENLSSLKEQLYKCYSYIQGSFYEIEEERYTAARGNACFRDILEFMNSDKGEWIDLISNRQNELSSVKENLKHIESEQDPELFDGRIRSTLESLKEELTPINLNLNKLSKIN